MTGYQSKKAAAQDKLDSMEREALKLALDWAYSNGETVFAGGGMKAVDGMNAWTKAIREALAQPEEEKLHPVCIGVDVTKEGTAVTAFYRKPDAVMEIFYSQFHPLAQPAQEPWRESASDYERGVIDGMQKQAQSSVDKAVNRMTQRTWVGLTKKEVDQFHNWKDCTWSTNELVRYVEAKLREKNT